MIRKITALTFLTLGMLSLNAQNSQKAKTLLDEVYNQVIAHDNIYIDFEYVLENLDANTKSGTQGDVTLKGNKYKANLFGSTQLYDGSKVYTIVPDNEEVTIEDRSDDTNVTPSEMLTFYRKGHSYAWDIQQNIKGRKIQFVKLVPIDTHTEIKSILLGIDQDTKNIYKLIETGNNGTKTTITVNSFKTDQSLSQSFFTFDEAEYKSNGYYIVRN